MIIRAIFALSIAAALVVPSAFAGKKPAHKHGHHYAHASGKTCKKEFMYMKGHKCVDARKTAKS